MIKKQTNLQLCQLFTSPCINIETLKRGLSLGLPALPFIYYQGPMVLCQCHTSSFAFLSCDLVDCWLYRDFRSPDGPSSLPLFLPFLPSLRNSHRCGAGGTRLPTSFLYEFSTKGTWVYFSFPSSSSGTITQHCSSRDRHKGCMLVKQLQRSFAIPALLASSCRCADGLPKLVRMFVVVSLRFQE